MSERRGGIRIASQALRTLMSHSSLAKWARPCTAAELLLSVRKYVELRSVSSHRAKVYVVTEVLELNQCMHPLN